MISIRELKDWLEQLNDEDGIAIDDGGLTLVVFTEGETTRPDGNYIEVGGIPLDEEEES
jgi:hypothetical protein